MLEKFIDVLMLAKVPFCLKAIGAKKINETGAALSGIADNMDISIQEIGNQVDQFKV